MKIKIARIITRMDLGGAQQTVLYLSERLDPNQFEQIVITGPGGILLPELKQIRTIRYYEVPQLKRDIGLKNLCSDIGAWRKIRSILRQERPQLVHTHTPKAGVIGRWAAWGARIPVIVHTYHGFGFGDSHGNLEKMFYIGVERLTSRITSHYVAVSDQNRIKAEGYKILQREKCSLIRSGVDFALFSTPKASKVQKKLELGLPPTDMIVGNVASLTPSKGLHYFLQAARLIKDKLPGVSFVIAGDGKLRPWLETRIKELRLQDTVFLLGWRRDIPELFPVFDVLLFTSLWEGLPKVLVESALSGIPIVASQVDGVSEITRDGENGFLVAPGDTNAMAERVLQLLNDPPLRQSMGRSGQTIAKSFSSEKMLDDYTNLYAELLESSVAATPKPVLNLGS